LTRGRRGGSGGGGWKTPDGVDGRIISLITGHRNNKPDAERSRGG
jgi:hypothetical protein